MHLEVVGRQAESLIDYPTRLNESKYRRKYHEDTRRALDFYADERRRMYAYSEKHYKR